MFFGNDDEDEDKNPVKPVAEDHGGVEAGRYEKDLPIPGETEAIDDSQLG